MSLQIVNLGPESLARTDSISIFVINMEKSKDRWRSMLSQGAASGVHFERIPATNGTDIPEWLADEFGAGSQLSPGEIGCYASHLRAAQIIVARAIPFAVILEDDVKFDRKLPSLACEAANKAPRGWDIIHLSTDHKRSVARVCDLDGGATLIRYLRNPVNTAGYILSNRGARKMLAPMDRVRPNDMDNRFAWVQGLEIFGMFPAIVKQTNDFSSDVGHRPGEKEVRSWSPWHWVFRRSIYAIRRVGVRRVVFGAIMNKVNSIKRRKTGVRDIAVV